MMIVLAVTQVLAVGTTTAISHAAGQRDHARAPRVFKQSIVLSAFVGAIFLIVAMALRGAYARALSADAATAALAEAYLQWFLPAMALQFFMSLFMPVVALSMGAAPVAGQNFGARNGVRVRETFETSALVAAAIMAFFVLLCHLAPEAMIRVFSSDPEVIAVVEECLRIVSWNYVASGMVFVTASLFQAMGNTIPSLITSCVRIVILAAPAFMLSRVRASSCAGSGISPWYR